MTKSKTRHACVYITSKQELISQIFKEIVKKSTEIKFSNLYLEANKN